jgi:hypothetical protein
MKILTLISLLLALGVSCLLLVVPTYTGEIGSSDGTVTITHSTLLLVNGVWALVPLSIPVLITLMPVLFPIRGVRIAAAVFLTAFSIIGGFSIGLFYMPSAGAMIVAGLLPSPSRRV